MNTSIHRYTTPCALKETDFRRNMLEAAGPSRVSVKGPEYTLPHPLPPVRYLSMQQQQQQGVGKFLAYSVFVGIEICKDL